LREDAAAKVRDEAARLVRDYDLYGAGGWGGDVDAGVGLPVADGGFGGAPAPGAEGAPTRFTDTNTQEAGVDEPDFVKTDGERIFLIHGNRVLVFRSWPAADTEQIGAIDIEGSPSSMFLASDKLVVYSHVSFVEDTSGGVGSEPPVGIAAADVAWGAYYPYSYRSFTKLTVVDVAAEPSVLEERYIEGWFRDARRHASVVRTIIGSETWEPHWGGAYPSYWNALGELRTKSEFAGVVNAWLDERLAAIAGRGLEGFLPDELVRVGGELVEVAPRCDSYYAPAPGQTGYGMAQVLTTSLEDLGTTQSLFVLGSPSVVYASDDVLVLAQNHWAWSAFEGEHRTIVHAFELDGGSTSYAGSGAIAGNIRNQFSIDEVDGIVRVAVTEQSSREAGSVNRVVTLRAEGGELVEVGRTPDMAEDESIFAVRYVGDRGYVVTFRQIDPLFVIDLSDPEAPAVLGNVEIPGFSTYMHPLSATHLLTIGRYVDPNSGIDQGMQLQIFDVSDPMHPAQVQAHIVGGYSSAEYDHKAFVFDPVSNLLAVPVETYSSTFESALRLFNVSIASGFTPAGSIDHSNLFDECVTVNGEVYSYTCSYSASMRRGVFIDDFVFAISYGGLTVHALGEVNAPIATANLPAPDFYYYPYPHFEGDFAF
ncbi:MAG: beta-propeller domain-containing protein, partial [Polyangiaceae bacterium]|nr:beta-propeller domain-containing protein [Polyangiaceae bacterium]